MQYAISQSKTEYPFDILHIKLAQQFDGLPSVEQHTETGCFIETDCFIESDCFIETDCFIKVDWFEDIRPTQLFNEQKGDQAKARILAKSRRFQLQERAQDDQVSPTTAESCQDTGLLVLASCCFQKWL